MKQTEVLDKIELFSDPEIKILEAANRIFLKYGIDGCTMMQIAEEAGISRTSLHYYFRNKTHLYQTVISTIEHNILPVISGLIESDMPLMDKIEMFVNTYIDLISANHMIPGFLSLELQRNPGWIVSLFKSKEDSINKLAAQIEKEIEKGRINPITLPDLLTNIIGLCVTPLLAMPIYMEVLVGDSEEKFREFVKGRKKEVMQMLRLRLMGKIDEATVLEN